MVIRQLCHGTTPHFAREGTHAHLWKNRNVCVEVFYYWEPSDFFGSVWGRIWFLCNTGYDWWTLCGHGNLDAASAQHVLSYTASSQ